MFWVEIGAKRPNYGQHRAVRWHRTVQSDTVFSNRPYLHRIVRRITVRYRNYGQESWSTAYLDKPAQDTRIAGMEKERNKDVLTWPGFRDTFMRRLHTSVTNVCRYLANSSSFISMNCVQAGSTKHTGLWTQRGWEQKVQPFNFMDCPQAGSMTHRSVDAKRVRAENPAVQFHGLPASRFNDTHVCECRGWKRKTQPQRRAQMASKSLFTSTWTAHMHRGYNDKHVRERDTVSRRILQWDAGYLG